MMQHLYLCLVGSIRQRALWLALLPAVLVATALASYFSITGMGELDEELRRRGHTIVQYLAPASEYGLISGNRPSLQALVQAAMQQPDVRAAVVTDFQGRVLAISGRTQLPVRLAEQAGDLVGLLASSHDTLGFVAPVRRSQLDIDDFLSLEPMPPQPPGSDRLGWVYVELSSEDLQARKSALLLHTLLILTAGLGAGAYVALRMARSLSRPVGRLLKAVGRMAAGELEARVEQASAGELGALERGFNHMASRLQDMHESMQERIATATAQLAHQASHDPLTGLANRREFELHLQATLDGRGGEELHHVLCYIDLDRFKVVNDTCGHAAGDELLRQITQLLRQRVRGQDLLARLGGDEFALLMRPLGGPIEAAAAAEAVIAAIAPPFEVDGHSITIGASVGIALAPGDGTDTTALMKNADLALYKAKSEGRAVFHFFEPGMDAALQRRRIIEVGLQTALARGQLRMVYQPLIRLADDKVSCFEALLRWDHPERGAISPVEFIPVAEETGLIVPIGAWVLEQACRAALAWPSDVRVAVNLSAVQFRDKHLAETIRTILKRTGLPAARLELEITESLLLADSEPVLKTLHALRAAGIRIAMDDFGTGYSSLSYLRSFPFDKIKIDRSFMTDLTGRNDDSAIVAAVIGLGHSLGMSTTAEGIETVEQLAAVRAHGCDEVQGFYFAPPLPEAAITGLLARPVSGGFGAGPAGPVTAAQ